ncbi:MAG TPA: response regulator transcription factor [Chloroflexota bacterium]|nr:response regulator transcription factor [Chloroflexota bacterium]
MQARGARILVVDDEPEILRALRTNLTAHGYEVLSATSGAEAQAAYAARRPDLILLDLGLPDMDGLALVERIRDHAATPIVVLSARGAERDKVRALDLGADDYLTKPFGMDELLARVRVALRHAAHPASGSAAVFRSGDLAVDLERRQVTVGGRQVRLTPTEYALLRAFITHPDKVLTRRMLLQEVWGPEYGTEAHYLHVYVASLRRKLEADPQRPRYLLTDPGVGYRFRTEPSD